MSIPIGHLPFGMRLRESPAMNTVDKEHFRLRLVELLADLQVSQRVFAEAVDIDPTYLSRLLYPPEKKGRKNLGMSNMASIRRRYGLSAGWFELPLGSELPSKTPPQDGISALLVREPASNLTQIGGTNELRWPFKLVSYQRLIGLKKALGPKVGAAAIVDIDKTLEITILKWEREITQNKRARSG